MSAIATAPVALERLIATDAHEGPVYVAAEDALYFTTVPDRSGPEPRTAIRRLQLGAGRLDTLVADANMANGMALAPDGRLVVCEQGGRRRHAAITLVDRVTGAREVVVEDWLGAHLNSPNDVAVASDGALWFTDPSYGHLQGFRAPPELPDRVYRHDPRTGATSVAADGFAKPNGLAFSPGETVLYVGDSERCVVYAYEVRDRRALERPRMFARIAPGYPDGITVDAAGRVYVSFAGGVRIFTPAGEVAGEIALPGAVNFCLAGSGRLLITTDDAVWAAVLPT